MHPGLIRYGDLIIEWTDAGDLRIIRQSTAEHITISRSEWVLIDLTRQLLGLPIASPRGDEAFNS